MRALVTACLAVGVLGSLASAQPTRSDAQQTRMLRLGKVTGKLTKTDPQDSSRHYQVYAGHLNAGETYRIDLESKEFDAFLRLEDEEKRKLAEDDDGGGGFNARLEFTPNRTGNYRILVASFGPGETGTYILTVEKVGKGETITGVLSEGDPTDRVRVGHRCKVHQVSLAAGETYQIDLKSQAFDAYLRLEDKSGRGLAENDDGGGGTNARLLFTPASSDTYRLIATTFQVGETGAYTLTISRMLRPTGRQPSPAAAPAAQSKKDRK